ncbi:BRCT domain-containing protein, partial [Rhodocollybia butyracea]
LNYKQHNTINIIVPHWFDDVIKLGMGTLDVAPYEWPNPLVLQPGHHSDDAEKKRKISSIDPSKAALYTTADMTAESAVAKISPRQVFNGDRILLSTNLELGDRRLAIESIVERADGVIVPLEESADAEEEKRKVLECDILVTKYRNGLAYFSAIKEPKVIASLSWLFHVVSIGTSTSPLERLLHYPIPNKHIEGFTEHKITITNFTGEAREYLKKLITIMGAEFTPSMSAKNTILIAAQADGTKTARAREWDIPIVNHTWLEDCFIKWKNLSVGKDRYIYFPPGVDLSPQLGNRGFDEAVPYSEEPQEVEAEATKKKERSLLRTQDSARDAREAADIVMP